MLLTQKRKDHKINIHSKDLEESILHEFTNKTKHLNYLFGVGVDFIYQFFNLDNKTNNFLSNSVFNILNKNKFFNKYATTIADKGINI